MAKHDFSAETSSTFEIVSAFIASLYYNGFYHEAKRLHISERAESVTEGYRAVVVSFVNTFDTPDTYRKIVTKLHDYYRAETRFRTISFSECINSISKHFIPPELCDSADSRQKNNVLRKVLRGAVIKFSAKVMSSDIIRSVIDDHANPAVPRVMVNVMVDALANERAEMFRKFFEGTHQTGDTKENFALVAKLRADIKRIEAAGEKAAEKSESRRRDLIKVLKALRGANAAVVAAKAQLAELGARLADRDARLRRAEADVAREREAAAVAARHIDPPRWRGRVHFDEHAEPEHIGDMAPLGAPAANESGYIVKEERMAAAPPRPPTPLPSGGDDFDSGMFDIM